MLKTGRQMTSIRAVVKLSGMGSVYEVIALQASAD
jgi:hypothetical protein